MALLTTGLAIFLGIHSVAIVAPDWRDRTAAKLGRAWRAIYSLISLVGFVLLIWGDKYNDWIAVIAGLAIYVVIFKWAHVKLFGVSPL